MKPNIEGPYLLEIRVDMTKVIPDEFDTVSGVGGKHLAPKRPLDYIVSFLTVTLLSAGLAGGGIVGLQLWDAGVILSGLVAEEKPVASGLAIALVDGTNTGIALATGETLVEEGWNVVSAISLADLDAALEPTPVTLIFVASERHRAEAQGLLSRFPGAPIEVSSQFSDPITVLIGNDYLD